MPLPETLRDLLAPARRWLDRDVPALPVDVFRVLVGLLAATHFVRLLVEAPTISAPDGLIDHALVQDIYWYTRIGLFQPGTPGWVFPLAYAAGLAGALMVAVGWRVRLGALVALVIAASAYRWSFIVTYLDDAVVHLTLFWMLLLPVGRTLTPAGLRDPAVRAAWPGLRVSGVAVRCLLLNVCWIYFIAGVWKLDSAFWRDGFGLYASMKVAIARMPDVWTPAHLPLLRAGDWLVMALEPVLPLPMLLRRGHPLKRVGGCGFLVFNLFIAGTLGITWAISGLTATLALFFAEELNVWIARRWPRGAAAEPIGARATTPAPSPVPTAARRWTRSEVGAVIFLALVMCATARAIRVFGALNQPAYAALWMVGVGQDYRLFNWIERVAFQVRTDVRVTRPDGSAGELPPEALPDDFRAQLLRGYAHGIRWLLIPQGRGFELRLSLARRQASWVCRHVTEPGTVVDITSTVHPIRPDNLELAPERRVRVAEFRCVPPGSVSEREGGVPVPAGWPGLQAQLISGVLELRL
jgi:hypothetical protein